MLYSTKRAAFNILKFKDSLNWVQPKWWSKICCKQLTWCNGLDANSKHIVLFSHPVYSEDSRLYIVWMAPGFIPGDWWPSHIDAFTGRDDRHRWCKNSCVYYRGSLEYKYAVSRTRNIFVIFQFQTRNLDTPANTLCIYGYGRMANLLLVMTSIIENICHRRRRSTRKKHSAGLLVPWHHARLAWRLQRKGLEAHHHPWWRQHQHKPGLSRASASRCSRWSFASSWMDADLAPEEDNAML